MMNIVVTGSKRGLPLKISEYLNSQGYYSENLNLHGDWKLCDLTKVDAIVHVAGITPGKEKSREDFYKINKDLTIELAKKAKESGVKHFVFFSSMAVYGVTQSLKKGEGIVTSKTECKPCSDYGWSKLKAEEALTELGSETFTIALIRLPSIYGKNKTEYIDQYKYLCEKFPVIPVAFKGNKKSAICTDNICELVRIVLQEKYEGVVCPDDGAYSTVDFCTALCPQKIRSNIAGFAMQLFLKNNPRIIDYYGTVCYSSDLSNIFDGRYRVKTLQEAVENAY